MLNTLDFKELADIDLGLTPEELDIVQLVREFAENELAPVAQKYEKENIYPYEQVAKFAELGFFGLVVPTEYGGLGASHKVLALTFEELSRVWMGFAGILGSHTMMTNVLTLFGTEEQKRRWLPKLASGELRGGTAITEPHAGSDVQAIRTVAKRTADGYRLSGTKTFLTNGKNGHVFIVVAKTDPEAQPPYKGISLFIAEKGPTFRVTREIEKLGYKSVDTVEAVLEDHPVGFDALVGGVEGEGFRQMMTGLESGRINVAARSVGIARAAYELALEYAQKRQAFGKPIAHHQAVQQHLAEMATKVEAARLLTLRAAAAKDLGRRVDLEAGMAKLFASEICTQVTLDSMRIHGGYGFTKDFLIERYYRDAPLMVIGEGTSEIQRMVIARNLLKRYSVE
ncbi:MAG TPA: acyl-CoA dehydrogenase family protein [Bacillota bacterium]